MPNSSTPAPLTPSSKITAATVYTDRAVVTRTAHVTLAEGASELVIPKLPVALMDASLQVAGRGTASATILDVVTRVTHTADASEVDQPRVTALQNEIEATEKKLRTITDRASILEQQGELIEKIENAVTAPPAEGSSARPIMDDLQKLLSFSQENRSRLATERQTLDVEVQDTSKKLDALRAQLGELHQSYYLRKSYKTVTVRVVAAKAGTLDLTLSYTIPGASWTPAYDARLRTEDRVIELSYHGIVRQSTGEDWDNITLTLSTARPALGGAAPMLSSWIVDVQQPRPPMPAPHATRVAAERVLAKSQMFNAAAAAPMADEMMMEEATHAVATVDTTATSASFKITAATSIPSDNSPQKVSIITTRLPVSLQYQATPAMQETAFLGAYVTNSTEFPFLAGSANVFLEDAFVATTALKTVMPAEKFDLSLGADEGIAIKRRIVNRFTESTGLTGKGRRVTYEFLDTITNNKKTLEHVVFKEALPVSRNEKIVVALITPSPKDVGTLEKSGREVTREEDGKLVWRLDIKPGEKREVPVKFSVEYPSDLQVSGLE